MLLLAGGVGGAKMAEGLAALPDIALTVIGNVADDDDFHGLRVCPDIDTLLYTLGGRIDRGRGWGVAGDTTRALDTLGDLGADTWMTLGDADLGLHIWRTQQLRKGVPPSQVTAHIAAAFGVPATILLPTDAPLRTRVRTDKGWLAFQEYFVREKCAPTVREIAIEGAETARPTDTALTAIADADLIVLAPSNPLVSIGPILAVPGLRDALTASAAPKLGVSPLIAGKVVKGPADRMMAGLGLRADALGVAERYAGLLDGFLIDRADADLTAPIAALGMVPVVEDILMPDAAAKARLARALLDAADATLKGRAA
ncbi:MAG: 2-phospho-L-lactate transferase [Pseudomonadota bacterium]